MTETSLPQAKVKTPLHLRLTPADWEECCKMLNYAEMKVFIWIRASDPYGERELKFSCSKLGEKLGLHKSSVSRALKSLDTKQLIEIDFEDVRVTQKVSNRRLTLLCKEDNGSKQEQQEANDSVAPTQHLLHGCNAGCADATQVVSMQRQVHGCNNQSLEPLPQADSKTLHTIQTSSDLNQTLSDGTAEFSTFLAGLADEREREKFLEFGRTEAAKLKKPEVVLVDKWIAKNFEELHRKFKATETATTPDLDEAAKAKQQEILDRRKKANEFLAELKDPGLDPKCVPVPQKNAVKPPESTEEGKLPNQKEEAPEGAENGKEVFSKAAIDERLAEVRAKAKAIEREKPSWKNIEKRGM